jgi:hypothetical protein
VKKLNKTKTSVICLLILSAFVPFIWKLGPDGTEAPKRFARDASMMDFSSFDFTPWDVSNAAKNVPAREKKPYTVMIYMNGSDLESENGAATGDILEILNSGADSSKLNIVLFTGGTQRWQNNVVPSSECVIWEAADGEIHEIAGVGLRDMSNAGTLASFIDFSIENFPAKKYGLVLWDHGGGSIVGYGQDEKFDYESMSLLELNYAFEKSLLSRQKIEFLGFDSCLMAAVEMSVIASEYFNYMFASEDLEPGDGWDYTVLREINGNPAMAGDIFGVLMTDYFMEYYGENSRDDLTMSVIDLSKAGAVMEAMGELMQECSQSLLHNRELSFKTFAKKRGLTKTFGEGSPRDNESDMVDIADMSAKLASFFPNEAQKVQDALQSAVIYTRDNSAADLGGMSAYYVYGGGDFAKQALEIYKTLNMDKFYTNYLGEFLYILKLQTENESQAQKSANKANRSGKITSSREAGILAISESDVLRSEITLWEKAAGGSNTAQMVGIFPFDEEKKQANKIAKINGYAVCLYKMSESDNRTLYGIPAVINGKDHDILVAVSAEHPEGEIIGAREEDGFIIQKGHDEIKLGDKISFYLQTRPVRQGEEGLQEITVNTAEDITWIKTDEFTVNETLKLEYVNPDFANGAFYESILTTNCRNAKHYSRLEKL